MVSRILLIGLFILVSGSVILLFIAEENREENRLNKRVEQVIYHACEYETLKLFKIVGDTATVTVQTGDDIGLTNSVLTKKIFIKEIKNPVVEIDFGGKNTIIFGPGFDKDALPLRGNLSFYVDSSGNINPEVKK